MQDCEALLAIEAIKQLKARYFHGVDTKDWAGFFATFAADAEFDQRTAFHAADPVTGASRVYGRPELLAAVDTSGWHWRSVAELQANAWAPVADAATVHHGYNPHITLDGPDAARGIWAMRDMLRFAPGFPITEIHGYGHYHETYRRTDRGWLIQSTRLTRIRIDIW